MHRPPPWMQQQPHSPIVKEGRHHATKSQHLATSLCLFQHRTPARHASRRPKIVSTPPRFTGDSPHFRMSVLTPSAPSKMEGKGKMDSRYCQRLVLCRSTDDVVTCSICRVSWGSVSPAPAVHVVPAPALVTQSWRTVVAAQVWRCGICFAKDVSRRRTGIQFLTALVGSGARSSPQSEPAKLSGACCTWTG